VTHQIAGEMIPMKWVVEEGGFRRLWVGLVMYFNEGREGGKRKEEKAKEGT
jgi:hypothetical protein